VGLDVHGYLIVGVPVSENDLFVTEEKFVNKCDECEADLHRGRRFCSNCGNEFKRVNVSSPTKGLLHLLKEEGFDDFTPESVRDLDGIIHNVNSHQTYDDERPWLAVGVQIRDTGSHRSGGIDPCSASWLRLEEAKAKALRMATSLRVRNPEVQIYLSIYYSY
jgi:hypothetical protein